MVYAEVNLNTAVPPDVDQLAEPFVLGAQDSKLPEALVGEVVAAEWADKLNQIFEKLTKLQKKDDSRYWWAGCCGGSSEDAAIKRRGDTKVCVRRCEQLDELVATWSSSSLEWSVVHVPLIVQGRVWPSHKGRSFLRVRTPGEEPPP